MMNDKTALQSVLTLAEAGHVNSALIDAVVSPYRSTWQTVAFAEAIEYLEFAAKGKAGKPRNCKKGYACGNGCISRTKECRKKHGTEAKAAQEWLKRNGALSDEQAKELEDLINTPSPSQQQSGGGGSDQEPEQTTETQAEDRQPEPQTEPEPRTEQRQQPDPEPEPQPQAEQQPSNQPRHPKYDAPLEEFDAEKVGSYQLLGRGGYGAALLDGDRVVKVGTVKNQGTDEINNLVEANKLGLGPQLLSVGKVNNRAKKKGDDDLFLDMIDDGDSEDFGNPFEQYQNEPGFGVYSMQKAKGSPVNVSEMNDADRLAASQSLTSQLRTLHKAGGRHNDLNEGNIMFDADTKEVTLIDWGISSFTKNPNFNKHGVPPDGDLIALKGMLSGHPNSEEINQVIDRHKGKLARRMTPEAVDQMYDEIDAAIAKNADQTWEKPKSNSLFTLGDSRMGNLLAELFDDEDDSDF